MIEHKTRIRVRYAETDQMRFAHHSHYIVWFEFARIEMLNAIGLPYARLEENGYYIPVLEVGAKYIHPAYFDEELQITVMMKQKPKATFRLEYEVFNEQNKKICTGYSSHSFMNAKGRAVKPPREFLKTVNQFFLKEYQ